MTVRAAGGYAYDVMAMRMVHHHGCSFDRYKFTGKERDTESGLDNFGARYNASSMGRFMSPDPDQESGIDNMGNPQMWNGYSYVGNNPLNRTDPSGRLVSICDTNGENCQTVSDKDYAQAQQQDQYNHAASLDQLKKDEGELSNITDSNGNVVGTVMYTPDPGTYPTEGIRPLDGQIYGGIASGWAIGKVFGACVGRSCRLVWERCRSCGDRRRRSDGPTWGRC